MSSSEKKSGKGTYQRKIRRIDYSKEEVEQMAGCAGSTLDDKIKRFCKYYDLPNGAFKQVDHTGRNFFPPEYTPLLAILLKNDSDNPSLTPQSRKRATADGVVEYNRKILQAVDEAGDITDSLKNFLSELPWYRTSKTITEYMDLLVFEIQLLICNLFFTKGTDVGEGIKQFVRDLDRINFNMYFGKFVRDMAIADNKERESALRAQIAKELEEMPQNEREKYFQTNKQYEDIFLEHQNELDKSTFCVDEWDYSIDQGIASVIKLIMKKYRTEMLQKGTGHYLGEFLCEDDYAILLARLSEDSKNEATKAERAEYLLTNEDELIDYLASYRTPGVVEAVNRSGKKWKSIPDRFADGEAVVVPVKDSEPMDASCELYSMVRDSYLSFINAVKGKKFLRDSVNQMMGSVFANLFHDSEKI